MHRIYAINRGLDRRLPNGCDPFELVTGLAEACGVLAAHVNHFEDSRVKRQKHRSADTKAVQDGLCCGVRVATHNAVETELERLINRSLQALIEEGWVAK